MYKFNGKEYNVLAAGIRDLLNQGKDHNEIVDLIYKQIDQDLFTIEMVQDEVSLTIRRINMYEEI